jgi:N-acetyl-anhydromuramyl-L-alanine amidase AmpD
MNRSINQRTLNLGSYAAAALLAAIISHPQLANAADVPVTSAPRPGDEIVVCGQRFHIGAPVVLWTDKGGYDFHYSKPGSRIPSHVRMSPLTDAQAAQVRREGWTPEFLRQNVDQFVIHYTVEGTSRLCYQKLVQRGLSVQFMLDLDGTIYQTMDLQEEAPHATKANGRSVGVEIANLGGYAGSLAPLEAWYKKDANGNLVIKLPADLGDGGIRIEHFVGRPARPELIAGNVQGKVYQQYDFTPQQYASLVRLTAGLCTVFPKITCDYPRQKLACGPPTAQLVKDDPTARPEALAGLNEPGPLIPHALSAEQYEVYQGVLGHYHVQTDKQDPGPAFQWDKVILEARKLMTPKALAANDAARGKPARFIPSVPAPRNSGK